VIRLFVFAVATIPALALGLGLADAFGVPRTWGVVPVLILAGWAFGPRLFPAVRERDAVDAAREEAATRPEPRRMSSRDKGLRPVARVSGTDPLDPVFGAQAAFPVDPDEGRENAHHLYVDPASLESAGGEADGETKHPGGTRERR
jgi:hypothetical protein